MDYGLYLTEWLLAEMSVTLSKWICIFLSGLRRSINSTSSSISDSRSGKEKILNTIFSFLEFDYLPIAFQLLHLLIEIKKRDVAALTSLTKEPKMLSMTWFPAARVSTAAGPRGHVTPRVLALLLAPALSLALDLLLLSFIISSDIFVDKHMKHKLICIDICFKTL